MSYVATKFQAKDGRGSTKQNIAVIKAQAPAGTTIATLTSSRFTANGKLVALKYKAVDIPTDTQYQVDILDDDGDPVHTKTAIADNSGNYEFLTTSKPLAGGYTVKWTWTTPFTPNAGEFETVLFVE